MGSNNQDALVFGEDSLEDNVILSISDQITLVQERKHLFSIFNTKLKDFIRFSHSTIFLLNSDVTFIEDLFAEQQSYPVNSPFYKKIKLGKIPHDDQIIRGEIPLSQPLVIDFDKIAETRETLPYIQANVAESIKGAVLFNLKCGPEIIGNWIMSFDQDVPTRLKLTVLQYLANSINAAVLNIISHEQLIAAREEHEILQAINADLSATKAKTDLLKIIHQKIGLFFDFGHHFVSLINEDGLTTTSFLRDSQSRSKNHPDYNKVNITKFPLADGFFNRVILSNEPVVFDLDQIKLKSPLPYYLEINYENGIRRVTMTALRVRENTIGIWAICQLGDQHMSTRKLELVKKISVQFSIAVENIRANEVITAKDQETTELLQLSFGLTTVRTKDDLREVICKHLKPLLSFNEVSIILLDSDNRYRLFVICTADGGNSELLSQSYADGCFNEDTSLMTILKDEKVITLDLGNIIAGNNVPEYLLKEYSRGIQEKTGIALCDESQLIGALFFHNTAKDVYTDHEKQMICGISYQISVVLSNIIANEKIAIKERERDILISLSKHIAPVRNTTDLINVISSHLQNIIGFRHTFITKVNDDGITASPFLLDPHTASGNHPLYGQMITNPQPLADGILNLVLENDHPLIFDLDDLAARQQIPLYLKINHESGIKQMVMVRLTKNNRPFGLWAVVFDNHKPLGTSVLSMISGIASQLSICVQNIIANERTEQNGEEKSRLITFSNAIVSVRDKQNIAIIIRQQLNNLFDTDDFYFFLFKPEASAFNAYMCSNDRFNDSSVNDWGCDFLADRELLKKVVVSEEPMLMTITDLHEFGFKPLFEGTQGSHSKNEFMLSPLRLAADLLGILVVRTKNSSMILSQTGFYKSICSQIAIALSNLIANEKVKAQLNEIESYRIRLEEEKFYLQEEIDTTNNYSDIIGQSDQIKKIFRLITQVAPSDSTVMILGETGTGKELIARAIHSRSPRHQKLMVKVNCAALPANLIESELFGHERGSFTGATERRLGKFELANNGTLFLDEIGEMPLELQVKLLRALQEKEIERIGGKGTIKVDVRIIAATNRDLEEEMTAGRFRRDLYYRLNIFPITLPPLRDRASDIPLLASHFVNRYAKKAGKKIITLSARALEQLTHYGWPGNIRELEHLIERSVLLTDGDNLKNLILPESKAITDVTSFGDAFVLKTIDENEREHILNTLKFSGGKVNGPNGAAKILGVPPSTLSSKMKRLGIKKEHIVFD